MICLRGRSKPLRNDQPEAAALMVSAFLADLANKYGARVDAETPEIQEATVNIIQRFGFLGLNEIAEAYRQWANNEIEVTGAEMYGGEFNARQVGLIISAYNENRRKLVAAYLTEKAAYEEEKRRAQKSAKEQAQFETNFFYELMQARYEKRPWNKIPSAWYDFANARGWIRLEPGEKTEAWNQAVDEYEKEKRALIENERNTKGMRRATQLLREMEAKGGNDRVKAIAKKLLIHKKLIS